MNIGLIVYLMKAQIDPRLGEFIEKKKYREIRQMRTQNDKRTISFTYKEKHAKSLLLKNVEISELTNGF